MNYLSLALSFFPYVLASVKAVEDVAGDSSGATKKSLVLNSIVAVAKVGEVVPEAHVAVISSLIDNIVSALNNSGIFKTKSPVVPVPATPATVLLVAASH